MDVEDYILLRDIMCVLQFKSRTLMLCSRRWSLDSHLLSTCVMQTNTSAADDSTKELKPNSSSIKFLKVQQYGYLGGYYKICNGPSLLP